MEHGSLAPSIISGNRWASLVEKQYKSALSQCIPGLAVDWQEVRSDFYRGEGMDSPEYVEAHSRAIQFPGMPSVPDA